MNDFPSKLNFFIKDSEWIFVRLSDNRLTGTYTEEFVCADLSLYIITLPNLEKTWREISLYYILALINSSLQTFYFRNMNYIKNYGLKVGTPQIRLSDLRLMPLPNIASENSKITVQKICTIVEGILKSNSNNGLKDSMVEIDDLVMDLYKLTPEEKEIIRKS